MVRSGVPTGLRMHAGKIALAFSASCALVLMLALPAALVLLGFAGLLLLIHHQQQNAPNRKNPAHGRFKNKRSSEYFCTSKKIWESKPSVASQPPPPIASSCALSSTAQIIASAASAISHSNSSNIGLTSKYADGFCSSSSMTDERLPWGNYFRASGPPPALGATRMPAAGFRSSSSMTGSWMRRGIHFRSPGPTTAPGTSSLPPSLDTHRSLNFSSRTTHTPIIGYAAVGYSSECHCTQDKFKALEQSTIKVTIEEPVSTFSADVDTASYSYIRRTIEQQRRWPQQDAVRVEEMINYFQYDYPAPTCMEVPFKSTVAVSESPWNAGKKLIHIGIQGYKIQSSEKPRSNLVFLLDTSGSMSSEDRLPLVKKSMLMLLDTLEPEDHVSIVTYESVTRVALWPTPVAEHHKIRSVISDLVAAGGTNGERGLQLAYEMAEINYDRDAVNRIILATDGDFNIGITDESELKRFVEKKRETGIFLSVLGFGMGNYQDSRMQILANHGNGVATYIDSLKEARKVLVEEATSTLFTIAKDVKLQVEFNPSKVAEYRLVGYEKRLLNREDFNNDKVDAGDIGAGHTVTAIYEITPVGSKARQIDPLRYGSKKEGRNNNIAEESASGEYAYLKIRYKLPDSDTSKLLRQPITEEHVVVAREGDADSFILLDNSSTAVVDPSIMKEFDFATAVAGFGQILKGGKFIGEDYTLDKVAELAQKTQGEDPSGYRSRFVTLVRLAKEMQEDTREFAGLEAKYTGFYG